MRYLKGFTLVELITAIGLSVLVLLGLGAIFAGTIKVWTKVQDSTSSLNEARTALQWITRDIMEGSILEIGEGSIKLDTVGYSLSGGDLKRDDDIVAQGVVNIGFKYYNKNGQEEVSIANINFVSILLTIEKGGHTISLRNGAGVRNYGTEQP